VPAIEAPAKLQSDVDRFFSGTTNTLDLTGGSQKFASLVALARKKKFLVVFVDERPKGTSPENYSDKWNYRFLNVVKIYLGNSDFENRRMLFDTGVGHATYSSFTDSTTLGDLLVSAEVCSPAATLTVRWSIHDKIDQQTEDIALQCANQDLNRHR
jgi:hypothetical protein